MAGLIGIFGGTFDPPHLGHLILAAEAAYQLQLSRLLWVLTPTPPHKLNQNITPLAARLELLQAALADNPLFELSMVEMNRPGPHYAVDTVRLLAQQNSGAGMVYLMGGDSLRDLPTWRQPQELLAACASLGVMRRPEDAIDLTVLESQLPGLTGKVRFINAPLLEISSREIRRRIACGEPYRYYLQPQVTALIQSRGLYQD
ncbi:MAG TPA: nicotinate-nucleotide adenylyltransferase [Anaerolineaceae bacterium]|nr:nicotinate-nucleotide adenylyltransferase [Anaerolineaceae bacterium]HPN52208.1 nicotinate-nucleotide adenylyltransferase [Anaerolineaceae bacterium]